MEKFFKKHPRIKTFLEVISCLELTTWLTLAVILAIVISVIVSCFVKLVDDSFLLNVLSVLFHGAIWVGGIALGIAIIIGLICLVYNAVDDVIESYRCVKDRPGSFAIEGIDYDVTNTGLIAGGQTVLTAPYKCKVLNRPVADSKTVYERGNDLFVVSVGSDIKTLKSPKNLILTKLLVDPHTEIGAGEILAIYEEVHPVESEKNENETNY